MIYECKELAFFHRIHYFKMFSYFREKIAKLRTAIFSSGRQDEESYDFEKENFPNTNSAKRDGSDPSSTKPKELCSSGKINADPNIRDLNGPGSSPDDTNASSDTRKGNLTSQIISFLDKIKLQLYVTNM